MNKAYFIDFSGSVHPRMLAEMAAIGIAVQTAGHEVYFLDSYGPVKATQDDLRRPHLLQGGGTPSSLDPFILAPEDGNDPRKSWEERKVPHSWEGYEVTLLTDGCIPDTLSVCFDSVLVFSLPKENIVREVMSS